MSESTPPAWTITAEHMEASARVVAEHAIRTALVPAPALGPHVWLKLETEQHTGSFKARGGLARVASLGPAERERGVVTASAGNHGLGVAFAGKKLGVRVTVFVPSGTPAIKRAGIAALGADIVVTEAAGYDATETEARAAAEETGAVFVSPYDDPWVAAGNGGTLGREILTAMPEVACIVAPVGGGGLMAGLGAARSEGFGSTKLIGVQSEASPAMVRSLETGRALETFEGKPSLAEGLEGGVSPTILHHVKACAERVDLVTEEQIRAGMRLAHGSMGLTVEGSAAVTLAWATEHAEAITGATVLIVSGKNVDESVLAEVIRG